MPISEAVTLTDETAGMGPVQQEERFVVMDVIRGFALFGVLASNMRSLNLPLLSSASPEKFFPGRADVWTQALVNVFISGKFYTMFAFLFGLGFAIQISRAQTRSATFPTFYLRRLGALAMFGLVHGILIWNGDILLSYAVGGFCLFWFRNAKLKTVGRWAIGAWMLIAMALTVAWAVPHFSARARANAASSVTNSAAQDAAIIQTYADSHLPGVVRETAFLWTGGHPPTQAHPFLWMSGIFLQDVGMGFISIPIFLLGLWVWRKGVLQNFAQWRPQVKRLCTGTLPLGFALAVVWEIHLALHPVGPKIPPFSYLLLFYAFVFGVIIFSCGYATLLALLFTSDRWRGKVAWLAPVGRMALTNYLMQSVVCVTFYSGMVTGLYGRVGPAWDFVATLVLYFAQVAFSHWWLARYRFGPMEWLWRTLTYGKRPAMRLAS